MTKTKPPAPPAPAATERIFPVVTPTGRMVVRESQIGGVVSDNARLGQCGLIVGSTIIPWPMSFSDTCIMLFGVDPLANVPAPPAPAPDSAPATGPKLVRP